MDYGAMLSRAWDIIWENKFLILLGVLVALSGTTGNSASSTTNFPSPESEGDFDFRMPEDIDLPVGPILIAVVVIGLAIIVGLFFWVVSTIARGGLIEGANAIAGGMSSDFSSAWSAAWQRVWRLIGIGVVPAIPSLILFLGGIGLAGVYAGLWALLGAENNFPTGGGVVAIFVAMLCIAGPLALVLGLLRTFANRACMIEDLGVFDAYRRGWDVLVSNIGPAVVLFIIQIVLSLVIGGLLILPSLAVVCCCLLWPLALIVQGAIAAYFSTLWTLAWREWTGLAGEAAQPAKMPSSL